MSNEALKLYSDMLIVEAILSDTGITKSAQSGIVKSIVDKVKDYVADHINPQDKLGSVINLISPGILWALGFPIIGFILKMAISWFGIDVGKIFEDIGSEIKSLITGEAKTTSSAVENVVNRVMQENAGSTPTQTDLEKAQNLKLSSMTLRNAQIYKATIIGLMNNDMAKNAQILSTLGRFVGLKSTTVSALTKIIGWIIKVILASAGFMVADDAIHAVLGKPSTTYPVTEKQPQVSSITLPTSEQTVFKVNPGYTEEHVNVRDRWIEPTPYQNISNEIIQWAKEIYPDLKDVYDAEIKNTVGFNKAIQIINEYNQNNTTDVTFMPLMFTSKKKVVDLFIDELAHKSSQFKTVPTPSQQTPKISPII